MLAFDELEHEVWLTRVRDARIDQAGDVRMTEPREDDAFTPEPLLATPADQGGVEQLDRDLPFIAAVAAAAQPHAAHPALTDPRDERVGANDHAAQRRIAVAQWRLVKESLRTQLPVIGQHFGELGCQS